MIVKGRITPDEFYVFKPTLKNAFRPIIVKNLGRKNKKYVYGNDGLKEEAVSASQQLKFSITDEEVLKLAEWACLIENHYKIAQDIEWAKDGKTGQLFIVQSRPETVFAPKTIAPQPLPPLAHVAGESILRPKARPTQNKIHPVQGAESLKPVV